MSEPRSDIELIGRPAASCPRRVKINGQEILVEWARVEGGAGTEPLTVTVRLIPTSLRVFAEGEESVPNDGE